MEITLEQCNKIATKEDLKKLASKADYDKCFGEIFAKLKIIMEKIDKIESSFSLNKK